MLKDITIGQYFPGNSIVHKLDPRMKIIITAIFIALLFSATSVYSLLVGVAYLFIIIPVSKIPVKMIIKSLKPIIPIVIFTTILNLFFVRGGKVVLDWWIFTITTEGIRFTVFMVVRIICLIAGTSMLTYTTSPIVLTDAIERLLSPLKKVKMPVHELAMMMTIALRFIPTLIEETDKIMSAQKARGADIESGGLISRVKALIPIIIPLFISAFRRAEELALAMECRCYQGGEGRTRLKQLKTAPRDYLALAFTLAFLGGAIALNILF